MESDLTPLESEVLRLILAGDSQAMKTLRAQLAICKVVSRKFTGVGFFSKLAVAEDAPRLTGPSVSAFPFGDVAADVPGLRRGAGFLLFLKEGSLGMLEGYTYHEQWPASIEDFRVHYQDPVERHLPAELR